MILLDSTVIVGFLDSDDSLHRSAVARLKEAASSEQMMTSVISYAEVMTGVTLGHHPADRVDRFFDTLIHDVLPVTREIAARAAVLRGKRRSLRMPDALIVATADLHEAIDTVVCGDGQWGKVEGLSCKIELLEHSPR